MNLKVHSFPGTTIKKDGKDCLYFGGTAYLGLQTDTRFQDIFIEHIRKYGTNYGASRKANVQMAVFEKAERHLARTVGSEACITLSSGYLAGQFLATVFGTEDYASFYAPRTHSALYQSTAIPQDSYVGLSERLRKHLLLHPEIIPVVFMDSIDFSGSNYPFFKNLKSLPLAHCILIVDDSHGIGIIGKNGAGIYKILESLPAKELIVCSSLGKGYAIQAGAIFGSKQRISELTATHFFGGASPAAPAALATLLDATQIYDIERNTLRKHIKTVTSHLQGLGIFTFMKHHPSFGFSDEALALHLEKNDIVVTHFRYPSTASDIMSKIIISAAHTTEEILYLLQVIDAYEPYS